MSIDTPTDTNTPRPDDGAGSAGSARPKSLSDHLSAQVAVATSDVLGGQPRQEIRDGAWAVRPTVALARQLLAEEPRFHTTPARVDSILSTPINTATPAKTGAPMAIISSIHYQLELLAQLDGELRRVQDDLEGMVAMYLERLGQIAEAGMVPELWNDFHDNVFQETRAEFARLRDKIQAVDRVKVRDYITRVEGLRPN